MQDASQNDSAEVWGKRIGRLLAYFAAAVLIIYFVWGLV